MSKIIDAVSAVFVFGNKIYAVKRQNYLKAFPGYTAFPGGKVDKIDFQSSSPVGLEAFPVHLAWALVREVQEEMNFDLVEAIQSGLVTKIQELGCAVTPDFNPVRFATHFYRIDINQEIKFSMNLDEAVYFSWEEASSLNDKYLSGNLLVVPPIKKLIQEFARNPDTIKIPDFDFRYNPEIEVPLIESLHGIRQMPVLSNTLFPATRTNCFVIGDTYKVVIDPSPKNEAECTKLLHKLRELQVSSIMLTHHHADHNEFTPELAISLNIPVLISQDSYQRLCKRNGESWFQGITIQYLKEGDKLTSWLGEDVLIYEIPGHDEGHLGIAPKSMKWFIAGDLFQGVGTVVVGGDEGDMAKYFQSLEKVIKLSPKVIYPSHGIALGGTYLLEKTLEHRKMREDQVRALFKEGKSIQEMLKQIYFDVEPQLHPYALANIESHLKKLKNEGKI